jgi:small subunit ribosomal protein S16
MVRIRLRRVGAKNQPSFRVVAAEKESPRDGRFLEILGHYNPRTDPATITLKEDRIYEWMKNGAQPSESVRQIFRTAGVWDRYERFKAGEALETLLEEAAEAEAVRNVNPKTRFDPSTRRKKKATAKEEPSEPEVEAVSASEPAEIEESEQETEAEELVEAPEAVEASEPEDVEEGPSESEPAETGEAEEPEGK